MDSVEHGLCCCPLDDSTSWGETSPGFALRRRLRTQPLLFIHAERLLPLGWAFRLTAPRGLEGVCRLARSTHRLWGSLPCEQEWLTFRNQKKAGCFALYLDNRFQGVEIGPQPLGDLRAASDSIE